jgi:hypothetical protein
VSIVWRSFSHWAERTATFVGRGSTSEELRPAWALLVATFAAPGVTAVIDAYSDHDFRDSLPPDEAAAMRELRSIGARRERVRDAGMAVPLDLADPHQRALSEAFGPFSIHADVVDAHGSLFGVHDGVSLTVTLTPDELGQLVSAAAAHGVDFDDLFERTEFHRPRFNGCLWSSVAAVVLVLSGLAWGLRILLG